MLATGLAFIAAGGDEVQTEQGLGENWGWMRLVFGCRSSVSGSMVDGDKVPYGYLLLIQTQNWFGVRIGGRRSVCVFLGDERSEINLCP
jgi:hypothetical protein